MRSAGRQGCPQGKRRSTLCSPSVVFVFGQNPVQGRARCGRASAPMKGPREKRGIRDVLYMRRSRGIRGWMAERPAGKLAEGEAPGQRWRHCSGMCAVLLSSHTLSKTTPKNIGTFSRQVLTVRLPSFRYQSYSVRAGQRSAASCAGIAGTAGIGGCSLEQVGLEGCECVVLWDQVCNDVTSIL